MIYGGKKSLEVVKKLSNTPTPSKSKWKVPDSIMDRVHTEIDLMIKD